MIQGIINRKKQGQDCTEQESAEIKGWLRDTLIGVGTGDVQTVIDIQNLFPNEYGEWIDEDQPAERDLYEVEYQQYDDGSHVCVSLRGDWICDCGPEGDEAAEENAKLIVNALNK